MNTSKTEAETFDEKAVKALHRYDVIDRVVKRIEHFITMLRSLQGAEALSAAGCLCVFLPLAVNPNFFAGAPYYRQLAELVSEPTCAFFFGTLALLQIFGLLLGAEPPAFPEDGRIKLIWLRYRVSLLVVSAMVWASMSYLLNTPTLTIWGCWCLPLTFCCSFSCIYLMLYHLKPSLILRERFLKDTPSPELST